MQKQLIAHKFTTGWEVVKGEQSLKRKPKSEKGRVEKMIVGAV
jgi:hypothetical protein